MKRLIFALLAFATIAIAADKPITTPHDQWVGRMHHATFEPSGMLRDGCVVGWVKSVDRYRDFRLQKAYLDLTQVSDPATYANAVAALDLGRLAGLRTGDMVEDPPALLPCMGALRAPPLVWTVSPAASAPDQPAYCLKADGTRDVTKACGRATATIEGQPMWCDCRVRSKETTTSTYCSWPLAKQTFDPAEPIRVTLCKERK